MSANTQAKATRTQPTKGSSRRPPQLHSELSSSFIPTRSRKDQAGDGQMSAAIRPPLDICLDRIRPKQSPGPHVHVCAACWCAGCARRGGLRKIMALQMTFEIKSNTSTHARTHTHGGAVHFPAQRVSAAPNLFAIWLICRFRFSLGSFK